MTIEAMRIHLANQIEFMEENFPDYEIIDLTTDQYHVFLRSLEAYASFYDSDTNGIHDGLFEDDASDRFLLSQRINALYKWLSSHSHTVYFSEMCGEEADAASYDRYLLPMPRGWQEDTKLYLEGFGILMREVVNEAYGDGGTLLGIQ